MFIWWLIFDFVAIILGLVIASNMKQSPVASTIGNGAGQLLSGLWTLQMTSEMVLGMDRDWREFMLEEAGGIGYFVFRFLGWSSVVMGAGMLLYALIRTLEAQKAQPKAQWPTDIPGQSQPYAPRPVGGSGQTQTQNASAEQTATQGEPETIFCPKCGRKQRKSNAACWACGANLQDK